LDYTNNIHAWQALVTSLQRYPVNSPKAACRGLYYLNNSGMLWIKMALYDATAQKTPKLIGENNEIY
jgi:hypothetical protein